MLRMAVLVVACDLPFLHVGLLARLAELSAGADAAWVSGRRGPEPLLACYRQSARAVLRREIDAGRLRAAAIGDLLRVATIGEAELAQFGTSERLLANVNTEADWKRALTL